MTIKETGIYTEGLIIKREMQLNDGFLLNFDLARMIPHSVWSPDKLPTKPNEINLSDSINKSSRPKPLTVEELSEEERQEIINRLAQQHVQNYRDFKRATTLV